MSSIIIKKRNLKFICINVCLVLLLLITTVKDITLTVRATDIGNQILSILDENKNLNPIKIVENNDYYTKLINYEIEGINIQLTQEQIDNFENAKAEKIKEDEYRRQMEAVSVFASNAISISQISVYTDLSVMRDVTADEMNQIINYWASKSGSNTFVGHGQTFIDASKQTGLDPVYLLAHAGLESGWGKSAIARDKYNYFGIGAFDSDPYNKSFVMANSVYDGIIQGAKWIDRNYYEAGQTSLYTMRYNNGHHEYCTSETWMYNIARIIQTSYSLID